MLVEGPVSIGGLVHVEGPSYSDFEGFRSDQAIESIDDLSVGLPVEGLNPEAGRLGLGLNARRVRGPPTVA